MKLAEPTALRLAKGLTYRDPGDVDGLTCWLDSHREVQLDSSGNLAEWRDLTGRGNHAVQTTAAARPIYGTDSAGRRYVQTTLAARFMDVGPSTDLDPHPTLGFTAYVVMAASAATGGYILGRWAALAAAQSWLIGVNDGSPSVGGVYLSEVGTNTPRRVILAQDCSTGAVRVLRLRYDPTGSVRGSVGGTAYGPTAIAGIKAATQTMTIGRLYTADGASGMDANVYSVMVFQRDLPPVDDTFIRDYLARRFGAA